RQSITSEVFRRNRFQPCEGLDVARFSHGCLACSCEFGANVTRQVLVFSFPPLGFGVAKDETFHLGQKFICPATEQRLHLIEIYAALLIERKYKRVVRRLCRLRAPRFLY